ncbi:class I adenylate-forming enzyme family protein [Stackebrandtia nassauensis]|uniref:AMP-dependent synthetase and ligase n=1 Tax=Stackebrandtia nassauensis (strain DSM 44728 / CIP 108903 / NRRL B-16338 / NBRC 102104 / LLR-40K-21) TaxID=446470 RepID=D3Q5V3_STANL|nr:AMP-binding protein [Stackebrandtia nassauensis]ADD40252.1 AMP-dependent synthetase and ligase [Stackebrandtia nassauensis DSM 44728]
MGTPVYPQTLLDALRREPESPAFEHGARVVARGELLDVIAGYVAGLRAAGVGPGKGVAIATATTAEGFAAQIAAHVVGSRVVGVLPDLPSGHLRHIFDDVEYLLVDAETGTPDLLGAAKGCQVLTVGADLAGDGGSLVPQGRRETIAYITFTSGSTGSPRGIAFTYAAMSGNWSLQPEVWGSRTEELAETHNRFLLYGSLSSAIVFEQLGLTLLSGGTAVIPEGPVEFPDVIERLGITMCLLSVPRYHRVLDALRDKEVDISSLRCAIVAGSPVSPRRLAEGFERLGPVLRQTYGQTEDGTLTMLTKDDVDQWPEALSSVGRVWENVQLEIRDAVGRAVPPGRSGEVWVRTPGQLCGYWDDEEETVEVLRDGWVRTRDLGYLSGDGFVFLTGRSRDIIIVNAVLHYAGPIERALMEHPDVDQAFVVGTPDEDAGEAIHAIILPVKESHPEPQELRELVTRELGASAAPGHLHFVTEIPVAPGGKPDKRALLARVLG